jgi:hypothetical protein
MSTPRRHACVTLRGVVGREKRLLGLLQRVIHCESASLFFFSGCSTIGIDPLDMLDSLFLRCMALHPMTEQRAFVSIQQSDSINSTIALYFYVMSRLAGHRKHVDSGKLEF